MSDHKHDGEVGLGKIYRAFGLKILSEIALPDLPLDSGPPDVTIRLGEVSPSRMEATNKGGDFALNAREFLGLTKPSGRFLVREGREVVFDGASKLDPEALRTYIMGIIMGCLWHQRGDLVFHASCVEGPSGALLFCGESGTGKSTTAAALGRFRNLRLMCDDSTVVDCSQPDHPLAIPALPARKLWSDSVRDLSADTSQGRRVYRGKHLIPATSDFRDAPLQIDTIYLLEQTSGSLHIETLKGVSKLQALRQQIFFPRYLEVGGQNLGCSSNLVKLVQAVRVCRLKNPQSGGRAISEAIMRELDMRESVDQRGPISES